MNDDKDMAILGNCRVDECTLVQYNKADESTLVEYEVDESTLDYEVDESTHVEYEVDECNEVDACKLEYDEDTGSSNCVRNKEMLRKRGEDVGNIHKHTVKGDMRPI